MIVCKNLVCYLCLFSSSVKRLEKQFSIKANFSTFLQLNWGKVDSPELPEKPEITEITENFTKVTKYLTKFKETLINYVWKISHVKKQ